MPDIDITQKGEIKLSTNLNPNEATSVAYGFRSERSTETQFLTFIHECLRISIGRNKPIAKLDFSKAFDKVHHSRLALKLDHHGVRGNAWNWISALLSNHSQPVGPYSAWGRSF